MDDRDLRSLLRAEGDRLVPGSLPDLLRRGRARRRWRLGGVAAAALVLVGSAGVVTAEAIGDGEEDAAPAGDSPTTASVSPTSRQPTGCRMGISSSTTVDGGFLEPVGYKS
jgi:hypothetical protein